jgi:hypothetical protein
MEVSLCHYHLANEEASYILEESGHAPARRERGRNIRVTTLPCPRRPKERANCQLSGRLEQTRRRVLYFLR